VAGGSDELVCEEGTRATFHLSRGAEAAFVDLNRNETKLLLTGTSLALLCNVNCHCRGCSARRHGRIDYCPQVSAFKAR